MVHTIQLLSLYTYLNKKHCSKSVEMHKQELIIAQGFFGISVNKFRRSASAAAQRSYIK